MGSRLACPESALAAAGIVGQWEVDATTATISHDLAGALFLFGDALMAGVCLPLSRTLDLIHAEDRPLAAEDYRKILASGGPTAVEVRVTGATGGERVIQVRGYFAWSEGDGMIGRGVLIDVTDLPRLPMMRAPGATAAPARVQPSGSDPLAEAAERSIEVRTALGQTGHGALRLAADLLLWEINTALAARHTASDKPVPDHLKRVR